MIDRITEKSLWPCQVSGHRTGVNESHSGELVARPAAVAAGLFDILVIDDGSTDDTKQQVSVGATCVLAVQSWDRGAMQTGYRMPALHGYDVAVQVDGDGQHRPSEGLPAGVSPAG